MFSRALHCGEGQQQLLVILRQDTEEVLGLLYQGV